MIRYSTVAATCNKVFENWDGTSEFTDEAILQLAKTAPGNLILYDFNQEKVIGRIISANNNEGSLVIEADIVEKIKINKLHRIVPGFIVDMDEWGEDSQGLHRKIQNVKSSAYGLTENPIEKDLPEIEKDEIDQQRRNNHG